MKILSLPWTGSYYVKVLSRLSTGSKNMQP
jgi:hypothetical protein